jgi:hypothetical protein
MGEEKVGRYVTVRSLLKNAAEPVVPSFAGESWSSKRREIRDSSWIRSPE